MNKCLNCGNPIKVKEGRRPRQYCDNKGKCRNEYWRKNKANPIEKKIDEFFSKVDPDELIKKFESMGYKFVDIKNLNQTTNEIKPQEQQKTNYTVDTTLGEKKITDEELEALAIRAKKNAIERIKELEEEVKNPPKNPLIGLSKWYAVRYNEIKTLKLKYNL